MQSRRRSHQLDELQGILKAYAFVDEEDALQFAMRHLGDTIADASTSEEESLTPELDSAPANKVIPILTAPMPPT